jgi:hypothetical protein
MKADEAIKKINAIGTVTYTAESKALIEEARAAYDALTDDQKVYINIVNLETLMKAEAKYKEFVTADVEKTKADKEAADAVCNKIAAIGTVEYTNKSKALIEEARAAYNVLTADQKELITDAQLKKLTDAENVYTELKASYEQQKAADAVTAKIAAIGTVDYEEASLNAIEEARAAYDSLTEKEKSLVTSEVLKMLMDAESEYKRLKTMAAEKQEQDENAAEDVVSKINAIGEVTFNTVVKDAIEAARNAYEELTDDQKKLIKEEYVEILADAEKVYMTQEKKAEEAKKAEKIKESKQKTATTAKKPLAEGSTFTVGINEYVVINDSVDKPEIALKKITDKKVKKVTVPSNVMKNGVSYMVTAIANNALKGCKKVKNLKLPDTLLEIGSNVFNGCESLTKVTIPKNVKTIGTKAFYHASTLRTLTVKSTHLEKVGKNALKGIHKKATIKVPKSRKKLYQKLFQNKGQAESVKIK